MAKTANRVGSLTKKTSKKAPSKAPDNGNGSSNGSSSKSKKGAGVQLQRMQVRLLYVPIVGDTPLITHAWSEKAKRQMLDKQMGKAPQAREKKDPEADFQGAMYRYPEKHPNFPHQYALTASSFKAAAVAGCRQVQGISMTEAKGLFFTLGLEHSDLVPIYDEPPIMREDMVRLESGVADIRFRPQYTRWMTLVPVRFDESAISVELLLHVFNKGGFHSGVGEWRPSAPKSATGSFGQYHVAEDSELEQFPKKLLTYLK